MIGKRDLKKMARKQAEGAIKSVDLRWLFGDELFELGYHPKGGWVHDTLQEVQDQIVRNIVK